MLPLLTAANSLDAKRTSCGMISYCPARMPEIAAEVRVCFRKRHWNAIPQESGVRTIRPLAHHSQVLAPVAVWTIEPATSQQ